MNIKKTFLLSILFTTFVTPAFTSERLNLEIIDFGLYENQFNGNIISSGGVAAGHHKPSCRMELIKNTDIIDGKVGVAFGFRFKPIVTSNFKETAVKFCGSHPPMRNPKTGVVMQDECFNTSIKSDKLQWHTFVIENDWEIVPGEWKLYIKQKGEVIADKSFVITQ